jgi:DNA-binding transcriptional LysR family regulator
VLAGSVRAPLVRVNAVGLHSDESDIVRAMSLRLPPLPALRFFDAAGRHLSFKRAAAELNVTPSAVSHGILGLEEALGTALFVREARGLSLTPAGADYLTYVSEALSLIAIGTQRLPGRPTDRAIAVSCAPIFASRWLLPRLQGFRQRWPKTSVTVDTSRRQVGFPVDGFDFAIRLSRAPQGGHGWTRLLGQQLVPVCSRAYRATLADRMGQVDLHEAALIHVITPARIGRRGSMRTASTISTSKAACASTRWSSPSMRPSRASALPWGAGPSSTAISPPAPWSRSARNRPPPRPPFGS